MKTKSIFWLDIGLWMEDLNICETFELLDTPTSVAARVRYGLWIEAGVSQCSRTRWEWSGQVQWNVASRFGEDTVGLVRISNRTFQIVKPDLQNSRDHRRTSWVRIPRILLPKQACLLAGSPELGGMLPSETQGNVVRKEIYPKVIFLCSRICSGQMEVKS